MSHSDDAERRIYRSRKRSRSESSVESVGSEQPNQSKRYRAFDSHSSSQQPSFMIVHNVKCSQNAYHSHHEHQAFYLDVPRLWADDSKANGLRGKRKILDLDHFIEEREAISFVVERQYDCNAYFEQHDSLFKALTGTKQRQKVDSHTQAYLFTLPTDGQLAQPIEEKINRLDRRMAEALKVMSSLFQWPIDLNLDPEYLELEAPYNEVYRSRNMLHNITLAERSIQSYISCLIDYVLDAMAADYREADELFKRGKVSKQHLPKLFRRGEIIVTQSEGYEIAAEYESFDRSDTEPLTYLLKCQTRIFDGLFRKKTETFPVVWPEIGAGELVPATMLSAFPLRFAEPEVKERLLQRGRKLWECRARKFMGYDAPKPIFELQTTHPRYMIDMATYRMLHQKNATDDQERFREHSLDREFYEGAITDHEDSPTEEFLLTLPAKVIGYGFHNKRWVTLSVRHLTEIAWDKAAFQRLVLNEQKKEMLEALITIQDDRDRSLDVIEGKGNGLILLLHGPPGTGKTLTAESVAELTHKPLYRVTCGDIGTKPETVERYLESVLHIGKIWDCVVLLDEADIFLEERSPMDLKRNALVSIFLRVLEYYEGILILTTNRVGTFDEAFKSRIQLAMHYPSLEINDRMMIWNNFIHSMQGDVNKNEILAQVNILGNYPLNGRQIRNTIKTARQLAMFQKQPLSYKHLDRAIKVSSEFEDYITRTRLGQTDAERALESGTRAP